MKKIRKRMWIVFCICTFLLLTGFTGMKVKGNQKLWELSWIGSGNMPYFQSSAVLKIHLKKGNLPNQVKVFVNHQQQKLEWSYEKNAEIYFSKEGVYDFCIEHKNGVRENQKIYVELSPPDMPKADTNSYKEGTWTAKTVKLTVYGAKSITGIEKYEYKIGNHSWETMKDGEVLINQNMEEIIWIRAVSKAGRTGNIKGISVKVWKSPPDLSEVVYSKGESGGWYQRAPQIFRRILYQEGPEVIEYFRLMNIRTKESCTMKNAVPQIKKDGIYRLSQWSVDEAGNHSSKIQVYNFKVDSQKPKIRITYKKKFSKKRVCRQQTAEVRILDENLRKNQVEIKTSGTVKVQWLKEQKIYKIVVDFQKEGNQSLEISARDYAGNRMILREEPFQVDRTPPQIKIQGIQNYESYDRKVKPMIIIKDHNRSTAKEKNYLNGRLWKMSEILKDGRYCLEVIAADKAGNQSKKKRYFTVNQRGIQIQFLQKEIVGKVTREKNFIPKFQVKSVEPVQVQKFLVNGRNIEHVWENDTLKSKYPFKENGKYTVQVYLIDASGEKAKSQPIHFTYDTKAPELLIKGLGTDASCFYGEKIWIRTRKKQDFFRLAILDGKKISGKKNQIEIKCKELGHHVVVLEALDLAGNVTKKRVEFTVVKVWPKIEKKEGKKEKLEYENRTGMYVMALFVFSIVVLLFRMKKRK